MGVTAAMNANDPVFADEQAGGMPPDLRERITTVLLERLDTIAADAVAIFPFSGTETLAPDYCSRIGQRLVQLLAFAVRDSRLDSRSGFVTDLHHAIVERSVPLDRLFTFAYLTERTALDELALDEMIGATSEAWPLVAQLVRRASFDLLAAYADRVQLEPSESAIIDRLTTLYTRPLFDAVLAKEVERAGRFGLGLSLILFDVDRLAEINQEHGYGVGDKILERLGITMRQYFRQHDWVARHFEDAIIVLLPRTDPDDARDLAERVRSTVQERLGFRDHRTDQPVDVTVSAAVVHVDVRDGDMVDPERLIAEAEAALAGAKELGRNSVVRVYVRAQPSRTPPHSSPSA